MLTFEQIKNSYRENEFSRNPRGALVEYLQYELLDSIFKQKNSEKLSFIGGTAVRLVYGSARFSEDLDFDNFGLSFDEFEVLLSKAAADMRLKDLVVEVRMVEKLAYHCYIKFPDLLFMNKLSPLANEKILIRVDAMHKDSSVLPRLVTLDRFGVYRTIRVNPLEVILAQKMLAVLDREKGRDLFDISYLYSLVSEPDFKYLKHYKIDRMSLKKQLVDRLEKFDLKKMIEDVKPFLLDADQIARVETFREFIKGRL